jgi:NADH:ubiquinone oxidoreductase subunit 5 (subunit L)/multisubunit Na+/H+ antiporter MnhA subunit
MRILTWVIALPIALAIVGIPARQLGYLTSQKLLDVIVKTDLLRFVPILVVIVLWALVTAALVTVLVEGGRRLMVRHRARAADRRDSAAFDGGLESDSSGRRGRRGRSR